MQEAEDAPFFQFLRATPSDLTDNPPLASSLQAFETALFLLALGRYPSALVSIGSALESALKAKLRIPPDKICYLWQMLDKLRPLPASLEHFAPKGDRNSLQARFSDMRNRIVHYGFSPRDDETSVVMLLETGFPFLCRVYEEYFDYFLDWKDIRPGATDFHALSQDEMRKAGLIPYLADHLRVAIQVYQEGRQLDLPDRTYCINGLRRVVTHGIHLQARTWSVDRALDLADECGILFEAQAEELEKLERALGDFFWKFQCPVCFEWETARFALDEAKLNAGIIAPTRGACVECGFAVRADEPFLAGWLLADQIVEHRQAILEAFTDVLPDDPDDDEE
jgi:HEPN domain-containing protein